MVDRFYGRSWGFQLLTLFFFQLKSEMGRYWEGAKE